MKNYVRKRTNGNGDIEYLDENDEIHRTDGPAYESRLGAIQWRIHGKLHRIDGPAAITFSRELWYVNHVWISDPERSAKLQELRRIFNDDDLLSFLLLEKRIVL